MKSPPPAYPNDVRMGKVNSGDIWKAALLTARVKLDDLGKELRPEDLEWAGNVVVPSTLAVVNDPVKTKAFIAGCIEHRFGVHVDEEHDNPNATLAAEYLVAKLKSDHLYAKAQEQLEHADEQLGLKKEQVETLKRKIRALVAKEDGSEPIDEEKLIDLVGRIRHEAPDLTVEDIVWVVETAPKFTDAEKMTKDIEERFSGRPNGQAAVDQAIKLMVSGRITADGELNTMSSDPERFNLTGILTEEECNELAVEMAKVGATLVEIFKSSGPGNDEDVRASYRTAVQKVVVKYLEQKSREIPEHYPRLSREEGQRVLEYCTQSLQLFVNDGAVHVAKIKRMTEVMQPDEFGLLVHLYNDKSGGDFLAKVCQWYEGESQEDLQVIIKIVEDFKAAVEFFAGQLGAVVSIHSSLLPSAPSRKPGRAAVRHYLRCLSESYDHANEDEDSRSSRLIWAALRNARVFEVSSDTFAAIITETQRYIWTQVVNLPVERMDEELNEQESAAAHEAICEAAERLPVFDDIMPFDHIFVGFDGDGQAINDKSVRDKFADGLMPEKILKCRILGYLIGPVHYNRVEVIEFIRITALGNIDHVAASATRISSAPDENGAEVPGIWAHPWHQTPWVVNALLGFIHEHKTLVLEQSMSKQQRRAFGRETRAMGFDVIPKPYYLVPLKNITVKDAARRSIGFVGRRVPLAYRHDRRGHERVFIQRGPMPLDEKARKKLEKPSGTPPLAYKIFTINELDAESARLLMHRKQPPKRVDEWVAIKARYIDQQVIGDESLPYVPAVRVSTDRGEQSRIGGTGLGGSGRVA